MLRKLGEGDRLEVLQRESWQLELLVTGFALAGMIGGAQTFFDWVSETLKVLSGKDLQAQLAGALLVGASFAYVITLTNFFFHVVLRCLWIGAIGSRSVMGRTIIPRRTLAPKFERFLRRRSGNFDAYIHRLDDTASLVFAFTFLLIIVALSFIAVTLFLVVLALGIAYVSDTTWAVVGLSVLIVAMLLFGIVYLIDFLTAGWLKRFRWFSHVYFPLYRLFGWITFARLYRPLYYNLLNRRGGRRLILLLIPYLGIAIYLLTLEITPNKYIAREYMTEDRNSAFTLNPEHYQDSNPDQPASGKIVIPSQIIRSSPLRVTLPLLQLYENAISRQCPDLPQHYESSVHSELFDQGEIGVYLAPDSLQSHHVVLTRTVMDCLTSGVELWLDEVPIDLGDVLLTQIEKSSYSELMKFVPIDSLAPGLHRLTLRQMQGSSRDTTGLQQVRSTVHVPFYYAPG
ncbi:hypothetical protein CLV84_2471 [Neolewinella xylanilytica]|uniref:Uncharacterized protein n=1 Tax=Neolewinella xylanilytica TaxID=1514080 RepID=A0A2S6I340_9BACT|nr:hypothetical protein [Neolewinella xylanilytica]PPK85570.1 hypothetical protein CLV84_2471 [Neolewinella xylanilytica]